jgi:hypothetical protein
MKRPEQINKLLKRPRSCHSEEPAVAGDEESAFFLVFSQRADPSLRSG